jgi:peptidoglycan hydrolase FlgJ
MSIAGVSQAVTSSPIGPLPTDPKARLRKAASELEAIWLQQFLKESRPKKTMLDNSFAAQTFQDMMDESLAKDMAARGVLGLADMLVQQLMPAQPPATSAVNSNAAPSSLEGLSL